MNNLQTITTFLGWCSVINLVVLCFTSLALMLARDFFAGIHSRMFSISKQEVLSRYLQYLSNYKIAIIMLNIAPYIALKIMSQ